MTTAADRHTYTLKFFGTPRDDFLGNYCPEGTRLILESDTFTLSNLCIDQAGVLGIIRSLHNLGYTLLFSSAADIPDGQTENSNFFKLIHHIVYNFSSDYGFDFLHALTYDATPGGMAITGHFTLSTTSFKVP